MQTHLEQVIGYTFENKDLSNRALTHASKSNYHLERQEFLGDAVLGLVIAGYLHQTYPDLAEGDLSKMRANLVCKQALLEISQNWNLSDYVRVGDGERSQHGGLKSESIAANAVESLIGAVFQDSGWESAKKVVLRAWKTHLHHVQPANLRDAKSQLQELTQSMAMGLPLYQVKDLGLNESPRFEATCYLKALCLGVGQGERKKVAELQAATAALSNTALLKLCNDNKS